MVKTHHFAPAIDHHLVAKVQARSTGANAHDVHMLLGHYFGLCAIVPEDPACLPRLQAVERRLRAFCQTGSLRPPND